MLQFSLHPRFCMESLLQIEVFAIIEQEAMLGEFHICSYLYKDYIHVHVPLCFHCLTLIKFISFEIAS